METIDDTSNCGMLDLYDDLITDESNKKKEDFKELETKYEEALARIAGLEKELEKSRSSESDFKKKAETLEKNISNLLVTARSEIQRKDRELASLRARKSETPLFKKLLHRPNFRPRSSSTNSQSEGETSENLLVEHQKAKPPFPKQSSTNDSIATATCEDKENLFKKDYKHEKYYSRKRKISPEIDVHDDAKKYRYGKELYRDKRSRNAEEVYGDKNLSHIDEVPRHTRESSVVQHSNTQDRAKRLLEKSKRDLRRKSGEITKHSEARDRRKSGQERGDKITSNDSREYHRRRRNEPSSSKSTRHSKERSSTPDDRSRKHDLLNEKSRSETKIPSRQDIRKNSRSKDREIVSLKIVDQLVTMKHNADFANDSKSSSPSYVSKHKLSEETISAERSSNRNNYPEKIDRERTEKSDENSNSNRESLNSRPWSDSSKLNRINQDFNLQNTKSTNPNDKVFKDENNSTLPEREKPEDDRRSVSSEKSSKPFEIDSHTWHDKRSFDSCEKMLKCDFEKYMEDSPGKGLKQFEKQSNNSCDNFSKESDRDKNYKNKGDGTPRNQRDKQIEDKEKYKSKSPERKHRSKSPRKKESVKTPSSSRTKKSSHKIKEDLESRRSLDEWDAMSYRVIDQRRSENLTDTKNRKSTSINKTRMSSHGSKNKHFSESDSDESVSLRMKSCIVKSIESRTNKDQGKSNEKGIEKVELESHKTKTSPVKNKEKQKKKEKPSMEDRSQLINLEKDREALLRELEMMNDSNDLNDGLEDSGLSEDSLTEKNGNVTMTEKGQLVSHHFDKMKNFSPLDEDVTLKSSTPVCKEEKQKKNDGNDVVSEDSITKISLLVKFSDSCVTPLNKSKIKSESLSTDVCPNSKIERKNKKLKKTKKHGKNKDKKNKNSKSKDSPTSSKNETTDLKSEYCDRGLNTDFKCDEDVLEPQMITADHSDLKKENFAIENESTRVDVESDNLSCDNKNKSGEVYIHKTEKLNSGSPSVTDEIKAINTTEFKKSTNVLATANHFNAEQANSLEKTLETANTCVTDEAYSLEKTMAKTNCYDAEKANSLGKKSLATKGNASVSNTNKDGNVEGNILLSQQGGKINCNYDENSSKNEVGYQSDSKQFHTKEDLDLSVILDKEEQLKDSKEMVEENVITDDFMIVHHDSEKVDEETLDNSIIISEEMSYTEVDNDLKVSKFETKSVNDSQSDKQKPKDGIDNSGVYMEETGKNDEQKYQTIESVTDEVNDDLEEGEISSDSDDEKVKVSVLMEPKDESKNEYSSNEIRKKDSERNKFDKQSSKDRLSFKEKSRKENENSKHKGRKESDKFREHGKRVRDEAGNSHSSRKEKESSRKLETRKNEHNDRSDKDGVIDKNLDREKEREGCVMEMDTKDIKRRKDEVRKDRNGDYRRKDDKEKVKRDSGKCFDRIDKDKSRYEGNKDEMKNNMKIKEETIKKAGSSRGKERVSKRIDTKVKSVSNSRDNSGIETQMPKAGDFNDESERTQGKSTVERNTKCNTTKDCESYETVDKDNTDSCSHNENSGRIKDVGEYNSQDQHWKTKDSNSNNENRNKRKRYDDEEICIPEKIKDKTKISIDVEPKIRKELEGKVLHDSRKCQHLENQKDSELNSSKKESMKNVCKSDRPGPKQPDSPMNSHESCEKPRKRHKSVRTETGVDSKYVDDRVVVNKIITSNDKLHKHKDIHYGNASSSLATPSSNNSTESFVVQGVIEPCEKEKILSHSKETVQPLVQNQDMNIDVIDDEDDIDILGLEDDDGCAKQSDILKQVAESEESFTCSRTRVWYRQPKHFESNTTIEHGLADVNDTDSCSSIIIDDTISRVSKRELFSNDVCQNEKLNLNEPNSSIEHGERNSAGTLHAGKIEKGNSNSLTDLENKVISRSSSQELSATSGPSDIEDSHDISNERRVVTLIPASKSSNTNSEYVASENVDSDTDDLEPIPLGLKRGYKIPKIKPLDKKALDREKTKRKSKSDHSRSHSPKRTERSRFTDEKHPKKDDHRTVYSPREEKASHKDTGRSRHKTGGRDKSSSLQNEHAHRKKSRYRHYSSPEHDSRDWCIEERLKHSLRHRSSDTRYRRKSEANDRS